MSNTNNSNNNQSDNYTELLNIIISSNVDKNEKVKMLNVIKENLQLNRQIKNANITSQPGQNYLINSRESLMITNNIMSSISRNEDRLYDLINRELNYTRNYNNNSNILFSSPFYTNQQNASFQPRQQP